MNNHRLSRRDFLKAAAVTTASVGLVACAVPQAAAPSGGEGAAQEKVLIKFFNRGGEYVFQTMDLQIAEFKKTFIAG